jgi:hypothetical protein
MNRTKNQINEKENESNAELLNSSMKSMSQLCISQEG